MIINHPLNIPHDLPIPPMRLRSHHLYTMTPRLKDSRRLRMQHKRDGEQAFDPFCCSSVLVLK